MESGHQLLKLTWAWTYVCERASLSTSHQTASTAAVACNRPAVTTAPIAATSQNTHRRRGGGSADRLSARVWMFDTTPSSLRIIPLPEQQQERRGSGPGARLQSRVALVRQS